MTLQHVRSADGTSIAFETIGSGPALILVGGAFNDRTARAAGTPLARLLAPHFSVTTYDRRGRGDSGDTPPYSTDHEVQDLAALIERAGRSAFVYGMSSGALLALLAAAEQLPIVKLALYEPPILLDANRTQPLGDLARQLAELSSRGARAEAVELFMTQLLQMPAPAIAHLRRSPVWPALEALAHTLSHDVRITRLGPSLVERARSVPIETLAIHGDAGPTWMGEAMRQLSAALPLGRTRLLAGQTHDVDVGVLAEVLIEFFAE